MERVETLCERLKEQLKQQASADELLRTVQMLQAELLHLKSGEDQSQQSSSVAVHISAPNDIVEPSIETTAVEEEEVLLDLVIDEEELEAELEEIRKNAQLKNNLSVNNKPVIEFDPLEEIPTLSHQKPMSGNNQPLEINQVIATEGVSSLNERLGVQHTPLSEKLKEAPIKDLRKAIGINDRFTFINDLFRGDEAMYERSIKTINGFSIYPEAEYWIKRELKLKLAWDEQDALVKQFDHLVKRRFPIT